MGFKLLREGVDRHVHTFLALLNLFQGVPSDILSYLIITDLKYFNTGLLHKPYSKLYLFIRGVQCQLWAVS